MPGLDLCSHAVVVPSHAGLSPRRFANSSSVILSESDSTVAAFGLGAAAMARG